MNDVVQDDVTYVFTHTEAGRSKMAPSRHLYAHNACVASHVYTRIVGDLKGRSWNFFVQIRTSSEHYKEQTFTSVLAVTISGSFLDDCTC